MTADDPRPAGEVCVCGHAFERHLGITGGGLTLSDPCAGGTPGFCGCSGYRPAASGGATDGEQCGAQHPGLAAGNVCREPVGHAGLHMAHDSQGRPEYLWDSPTEREDVGVGPVPDEYVGHVGSCRIFYAEHRCTCTGPASPASNRTPPVTSQADGDLLPSTGRGAS